MRATYTWGEGPDVLLVLDGTRLMTYEPPSDFDRGVYGYVHQGSVDLTAGEARALAAQLLAAAEHADELDRMAAAESLRW